MKEYKIVYFQGKSLFNLEKLNKEIADFLNEYARQGWRVIECENFNRFLLERDRH